jgi:hypothetical protein
MDSTTSSSTKTNKRSSKYDKELISQAVLDGMMFDNLSCFKACEKAGVPISTFMGWVSDDPDIAERYAHAREILIEKMAEDLLMISDEPVNVNAHGTTDNGAVQKQRLQVDTRKWLLSKLAPKKYGDKVELATEGKNQVQIKYGWEQEE